jgi:hypothetical protein
LDISPLVSFLGLASLAAGQSATEKDLPQIANPETLTIEMAKPSSPVTVVESQHSPDGPGR